MPAYCAETSANRAQVFHRGVSAPSCCAFIHRVTFEEVTRHRDLINSDPLYIKNYNSTTKRKNLTKKLAKNLKQAFLKEDEQVANKHMKRSSTSLIIAAAAATAAKSLQSCPTLCDPTDGSPPGSAVPGILQARTLEWVAISFSNA